MEEDNLLHFHYMAIPPTPHTILTPNPGTMNLTIKVKGF